MKEFTVEIQRRGKSTTVTGTLEYLKGHFGYLLECGKAYERERGARKVNLFPKTGKALVTALNNAASNKAANGCSDTWYGLR